MSRLGRFVRITFDAARPTAPAEGFHVPFALRNAVTGCALAVGLAMPAGPAQASGAVHFSGAAHIDCHGCGYSGGDATMSVTGTSNGVTLMAAPANATFTAYAPYTPACMLSETVNGSAAGALDASFTWSRLGNVAVITTYGDITGSGTAVVTATSPLGLWCGGPVTFYFEGALGGT